VICMHAEATGRSAARSAGAGRSSWTRTPPPCAAGGESRQDKDGNVNGRRSLGGAPDDQIFFMETWMGDGDKTRMKMMNTVWKCLPAHPPWGPSHAQHTST
jgi:hypothetical protein